MARFNISALLLVTSPPWSVHSSSAPHGTSPIEDPNISTTESSQRAKFNSWLERHDKPYSHNHHLRATPVEHSNDYREEYEQRLKTFVDNNEKVGRHNNAFERGYTSYAMTTDSPFADMTNEEFRSVYLMEEQNCSATHRSSVAAVDVWSFLLENEGELLPKSIDWRTKGILTPIKNQKQCGSCWTFSTTGTLESHLCLNDASLDCAHWTGLSEQHLLDCSSAYDNHGCNGGLPSHAFEYIKETGGLDTEEAYPYRADDVGPCGATQSPFRVAEVYNITTRDEDDLVNAIANVGPVSVAFDVAGDFHLYSHGVYDSFDAESNSTVCKSDSMSVNHAVVAVGYGETDGDDMIPFYIVRNSWSNTWGMEGYFWIKRGDNLCGISDCASFPIVPALKSKVQGVAMTAGGVEKMSLRES